MPAHATEPASPTPLEAELAEAARAGDAARLADLFDRLARGDEAGRWARVARALAGEANHAETAAWLLDLTTRMPDTPAPWALLAVLRDDLDDWEGANEAALEALARLPEDYDLMRLVRGTLRKAQRWTELVEHLEAMTTHTANLDEQVSLHEEIADVLVGRMNSPLEAVGYRRKADQFRDVPGMIAAHWQTLAEGGSDPAVWDEVESFFRDNGLWDEVVTLLHRRLENAYGEELALRFEQLHDAYTRTERPRWDRLEHELRAALERPSAASVRPRLDAVLSRIRVSRTAPAAPERAAPPEAAADGVPMVVVAGAVIAFAAGVALVAWVFLS